MKAEIYWIEAPGPGRLAIMPRPRGGDWLGDDMRSLRDQGATVIASLLEAKEAAELELASEPESAREAGLEYLSFPIPDRQVPGSWADAVSFIQSLRHRLDRGAAVAVHCRAGIGRSPLIAAAVLLTRGVPLPVALESLARARGFPVPETAEQRDWLVSFGRRVL